MKCHCVFWTTFLWCFLFLPPLALAREDTEKTDIPENAWEQKQTDVQEKVRKGMLEEFDFSGIEDSLQGTMENGSLHFRDLFFPLLRGDVKTAGRLLFQAIWEYSTKEFADNKKNLVALLLVAIVMAIFTNFSNAFQRRQTAEVGFYVLYFLLITLCLRSFQSALAGVEGKIGSILEFMRALCPAYFMAVAISVGSRTALVFYQMIVFLIYLAQTVIVGIFLPLVRLYVIVQLLNHLSGEETVSELAALLKKGISWCLKSMLGCVTGWALIQRMLAPVIDSLHRHTTMKAMEAIPGVGNTFGKMADIVLGTALLIKNGMGVAGAFVLLLVSVAPVVQMGFLALLYKVAAALVQPVSDGRVTGYIHGVSEGYGLLLQILFTVILLFLVAIAVVSGTLLHFG